MESLPQRASQRRQSPAQGNGEQSHQDADHRNDTSQPPDTVSIDSQTLLLSDRALSEPHTDDNPTAQSTAATQPGERSEPRKCWICFNDETEDSPESSHWRTPCNCALTAHESCILDWVADMEAPDQSRSVGSKKEIRCPQCKSEIHLSRPRSVVVDAVAALEKLRGMSFLAMGVMGLGSSLMIVFSHHGAHTIRMIFGHEDAEAILAPVREENQALRLLSERFPSISQWCFKDWSGWRVFFGLPLIPITLIASRTTLANAVLPILPMIFLVTPPTYEILNQRSLKLPNSAAPMPWPPSPSFAFVLLPYLRGIYDEMMERIWGERERGWLKEIQPRYGQGENAENQRENNQMNQQNDEEVIELELGIDIPGFGGNRDDQANPAAAPAPQVPRDQAPDLNAVPVDEHDQHNGPLGDQVGEQEQGQQDRQQQGNRQQGQQQQQNDNILISGTRIAHTMIGALLFPTISATMGGALRLLLPSSWTTPPTIPSVFSRAGYQVMPTGMLQTRWGRSIVGGCLFVVLKDAVRIYCRWRMAQSFRQRRVMNWDKKRGKPVL